MCLRQSCCILALQCRPTSIIHFMQPHRKTWPIIHPTSGAGRQPSIAGTAIAPSLSQLPIHDLHSIRRAPTEWQHILVQTSSAQHSIGRRSTVPGTSSSTMQTTVYHSGGTRRESPPTPSPTPNVRSKFHMHFKFPHLELAFTRLTKCCGTSAR